MTQQLETSQARVDAAAAVRRLIHAVVGHDAGDDELARVAAQASDLADRLEGAERRVRPAGHLLRYESPVADGGELTCWPDCMIAGEAHPTGTGLRGHRVGDEVEAEVVLGPAHEGPPGRAHGGMVASLFDEVFGLAMWMDAVPGYTARLEVSYRQPTPLGRPIRLRCRVDRRDGRKIHVTGTAHDGETLVADAAGLFIVPRDAATSGP